MGASDPRDEPDFVEAVNDGLEHRDSRGLPDRSAVRAFAWALDLAPGLSGGKASAVAAVKHYRKRKELEGKPPPGPMAGPQVEVYRFQRTEHEEIRASYGLFRGRVLIHLRTWEQRKSGWRPTTRGLALPLEQLSELEAAISALGMAVKVPGLAPESQLSAREAPKPS